MLANINGIMMYYEDKGQGPALIFVHGLGENADFWHFQTEAFSASFRTIILDQRGHHRTEDGKTTITLDHLREDIIALLDHLRIAKAHFVGHSMGSKVLQEIIAHYPDRFLTLTLCSTCAHFGNVEEFLKPRLQRIDDFSMEQLGATIASLACHPDFPEKNPAVYQEIKHALQSNRKEAYRQCTSIIGDPRCDHRASLPQVRVPSLIMVGERDKTTTVQDSEYLNLLIPGSILVLIPDAAHMAPLENPQAVNLALAQFLNTTSPDSTQIILEVMISAYRN